MSPAIWLSLGLAWPTIAMAALVFAVWLTLFVQRAAHMRRHPPGPDDFASGDAARAYFRPVEMAGNNLANIFEMPVLYFALVPLIVLFAVPSTTQVVLAWLFVGCRAVHSFIHIGPKRVLPRFWAYLASCIVLSAMWIGFAVDIARVARLLATFG
ncbi:MAG: MAPEG family protein [Sphingomonas fennica]